MTTNTKKLAVASSTALTAALGLALLGPAVAASAHGYVEGDALTTRAAMEENADRGPIAWEPQSLEAPKGFPAAGPADGQLASAGQAIATNLDEQSEDRWVKNDVKPGPVDVAWNFTAAHMTTQWRYFMTVPGWDPNDELDRDDFELIETVEHDGSAASNNPVHTIDIPEDRTGYHVIYAVWDVADTANAFYNVIDVNVDGDIPSDPDTEAPSDVTSIDATSTSSTTADISWDAATDNTGVTEYQIFTGTSATPAATVKGTQTSAVLTGLTPDTDYAITVIAKDAAGNESGSSIVPLHTLANSGPDTQNPTAPTHLHAMDITATSVDLMWGKATDDTAVTEYKVWDALKGEFIATTDKTSLTIDGLTAGSVFGFAIYAFDAAGNMSSSSNILGGTTSDEQTDPSLPVWDAFGAYEKGDRVSFEGGTYEAVQSYQGVGDTTWIHAIALWTKIS